MAYRFVAREHGATFATRGRGAELRERILEASDAGSPVIFDFDGVLTVSASFADEFLGKIAVDAESRKSLREIEVRNASEKVNDVIDRVLERRRFIADHGPVAVPL